MSKLDKIENKYNDYLLEFDYQITEFCDYYKMDNWIINRNDNLPFIRFYDYRYHKKVKKNSVQVYVCCSGTTDWRHCMNVYYKDNGEVIKQGV